MNALTDTSTVNLPALTDEQLGRLASMPMTPEQWDLLEEEMARRVSAGQTDEWSFDLDGAKVVS